MQVDSCGNLVAVGGHGNFVSRIGGICYSELFSRICNSCSVILRHFIELFGKRMCIYSARYLTMGSHMVALK